MKKILLFMVALSATSTLLAQDIVFNGINYEITNPDNLTVTVTGPNETFTGVANIPDTVEDEETNTVYTVKAIGEDAFRENQELTAISISNLVTSIGSSAFVGCTNLKTVNIPNSLKSINKSTFSDCTSLESISIPDSVTDIGWYAFYNTGLTSVTIPNSVTTIGNYAFEGTALKSVIIPNSVSIILFGTFKDCVNLTSVTIPNSVTDIYDEAFKGCTNLEAISIPNSIIKINKGVFQGTGLTSVFIPNTVNNIDDYAFSNCSNLLSITLETASPLTINAKIFEGVNVQDVDLNVPAGSVSTYENAAVWGDFNIVQSPIETNQTFCEATTVLSLWPAPSATLKWYDAAIGGNLLNEDDFLVSGSYFASVQDPNEVGGRTEVLVSVNPLPELPVVSGTETAGFYVSSDDCMDYNGLYALEGVLNEKNSYSYTQEDGYTYKISFNGEKWVLYDDGYLIYPNFENTTVTSDMVPPVSGWTSEYCVDDLNLSASTFMKQAFCQGSLVSDILVTANTDVNWYNSATSTSVLDVNTELLKGTYYVATVNPTGCESARVSIQVSVISAPNSPILENPALESSIYVDGSNELDFGNFDYDGMQNGKNKYIYAPENEDELEFDADLKLEFFVDQEVSRWQLSIEFPSEGPGGPGEPASNTMVIYYNDTDTEGVFPPISGWVGNPELEVNGTLDLRFKEAEITYTQNNTAEALSATSSGTGLLWYTEEDGTGSTEAPTPSTVSVGSTSYWVSSTNDLGCESTRSEIVVTVEASLNIEDSSVLNNTSIYPNPTHDYVSINLPKVETSKITIYDLNGRLLLNRIQTDKTIEVDLSRYETGVYIVKIQVNQNEITKRILKQ
ncbi:leucine-rich repeat protein [Tamlana sp. 2_MG-2023]|uniref:leucine-rich repeat protein n=1 Tax=unclassified Tamlana TaxID=2614803 RepID=UPI0026E1F65F|nr:MULTISPECIES: leucine-rich repeat protein [unclassified Tamlana]MDO6761803.1 leucine-rich repeat protein [Tamlana sp. 2_MG-2023]MDO6792558.1 leucine-rich repeat protein [Tamlana sp. 1_MG-2023]